MNKTTVYLPEQLKRAVERLAASTDRSEAEVIRQAIEELTAAAEPPRPKGGLFASSESSLSESVDDALVGFGDR